MTKTEKQTHELMRFMLPGLVTFFVVLFLFSPRCAAGVAPYALLELLGILAIGKIVGYLRGEHGLRREA
jgi:UPF0716 family protein affecting phage T7 exclusion